MANCKQDAKVWKKRPVDKKEDEKIIVHDDQFETTREPINLPFNKF